MKVDDRILALRQKMKENGIDAYLVPSSDPHQSEYVADHWKLRPWISGFTGSAGIAVITHDHAGIWTDSRYFLQAEEELANSEMVLHKQLVSHAPEHINWIVDQLNEGGKVGCDGLLFSVGQLNMMKNVLATKGIAIDYDQDLIKDIWADRPPLPKNQIFEHDLVYAGKTRLEKLTAIRTKMTQKGADYHLVSTLDNIAWIFNIRSNDVECNPVTIAYAVLGQEDAFIFIDESKVSTALKSKLENEAIFIKPYEALTLFLSSIPRYKKMLVDSTSTSVKVYDAIRRDQLIQGSTISSGLKAVKNEVEVGHIKNAMLKDGVALTKLYRWLEATLSKGSVKETDVAKQLDQFRRDQGNYHGESFSAIVGYNSNGAIVHYHPMPETCADIKSEGILLLDSGGQYIDGTTDITRTTALGTPSDEQKRNFTLVLKGHIALATMRFPKGTKGIQLDTLARQYLWKDGLDYGHGTGHGVGFFLNVHEPPQGFATSATTSRGATIFEPGMFTSNEPGFYKTGEYGIRIENLVLTVEDEKNEYGDFLKFETLTLFPIDQNLIETKLLSSEEKNWLNNYHNEVFEKISPLLNPEEQEWLKTKCQSL